MLLAAKESAAAAAERGQINVETRKEAKQAEARYLYICNAAGSADKTSLFPYPLMKSGQGKSGQFTCVPLLVILIRGTLPTKQLQVLTVAACSCIS